MNYAMPVAADAIITDTEELKTLCARLKKAEYLTVDTEFIRERTYWAQLCLVQVAGPDEACAIDPLAEGLDLSPLYDLLHDKKILKVLHACRQDMEIFYKESGSLPGPVFDTQIAAQVCGFGEQVSYDGLVSSLLRKNIDKSSRFTDWARRPLTAKQVKYALDDVVYLRPVYEKLAARIEKEKRGDWIMDEMKELTDTDNYTAVPEDMWQRIRIPSGKPRALAILRELAAWRELMAQRVNVPRGRILKDEALAEIATHPPTTREALARMRNVSQGFADGARGQEILDAVKRGLDADEKDLPQRALRAHLPPGAGPTIDLLRVLLKLKCEESGVAPRLLCPASDLELIAAHGAEADVPAMKGWRRELFGDEALDLCAGKVAVAVEKGHLKLVRAT